MRPAFLDAGVVEEETGAGSKGASSFFLSETPSKPLGSLNSKISAGGRGDKGTGRAVVLIEPVRSRATSFDMRPGGVGESPPIMS